MKKRENHQSIVALGILLAIAFSTVILSQSVFQGTFLDTAKSVSAQSSGTDPDPSPPKPGNPLPKPPGPDDPDPDPFEPWPPFPPFPPFPPCPQCHHVDLVIHALYAMTP